MDFWSAIAIGFKEMWANKFRSLLTMLGIILGVSSLVAMSALVNGMEKALKEALVAMGGLEKIRVETQSELPLYQRHLADQAPGLTLADVYALQENAPLLREITPSIDVFGFGRGAVLSYRGKYMRPFIFSGTWPSALGLNEHTIGHGRMFNEVDDAEARSVCVIGTGIRDELFGSPEQTGRDIIPLGEVINISGQPFTIIGMFPRYESEQERKRRLAEAAEARADPPRDENPPGPGGRSGGLRKSRGWGRGGPSGFVFRLKNSTVYIPLRTMLIKFRSAAGQGGNPDFRLTSINMRIPSVDVLDAALQQVRNVMLLTHDGIEDFGFRTQEDWATQINLTIANFRASRSMIAAICLIVGGIGIMNIMLASISERVREIGIRKAVGATTTAVFLQILIESLVLALLGGLLGLVTAFGLVRLIASFTPTDNTPIISLGAMLLAFGCSALMGVLAGLFPAFKASRLDPIQALRYE